MNRVLARHLLMLLVIFFSMLVLSLKILDIRTVFEPRYLLPVLNTTFLSFIPFILAYLAAKSYLKSQGKDLLIFLSSGMFALGLGGLISGWFIGKSEGPNLTITIYNSSVLLCSLLHASGASISIALHERDTSKHRKLIMTIFILSIISILGIIYYEVINNRTPHFIEQGIGPTFAGRVVLGSAIVLFTLSSIIFNILFKRNGQKLLQWYSTGLALVAIGLTGVLLQKAVGSPIGWAGRFAQYTGISCILFGVVNFYNAIRRGDFTYETALSAIFAEAEENYKALIDSASDGIVLINQQGRVLLWNNAAERLSGYSSMEAIGSLLKELVFPDTFPEEPESGVIEADIRRRDGVIFPAEISISRRIASSGTLTTFIIKDISRRKQDEGRLQVSEELYRSLFENMLNGFAYCQMEFDENENPVDLTYLAVNSMFESLTGLKSVIGKKLSEVIPGHMEKDPEILEVYGRVSKTGKPERKEIFIESLQQWYSLSVYSNRKGYFAAVFDVITDRKLAETVQNLLKEKDLILKEVHHRIKNNMNTIKGLLFLQANSIQDQTAIAILKDAQSRVESMSLLYNKLYCSDNYNTLSVKDYLHPLIDEILSNFPCGSAVKVEKKIEDIVLNVKILQPLGIIINELLTNTMKYAFPGGGGIITVSAFLEKGIVTFIISDNGAGMPESITFENSTGFGMKLIRMLTEQIGGSIKIERGDGTRFVIEFGV